MFQKLVSVLTAACFGFTALIAVSGASAQTPAQEQVPLRKFFEHRQFTNIKLSPDAKHMAFTYEHETEVRLAVMESKDGNILSHFTFGENMHVQDFFWANDERVVMAVGKVTGYLDNDGRPTNLYAANIDGSQRREIFEMASSRYALLSRLPKDDRHILIAKYHWADGGKGKVHRLNIYNGNLDYTAEEPPGDVRALEADIEGRVRMAVEIIEGKTEDDTKSFLHVRGVGEKAPWKKVPLAVKRKNPLIDPIGFNAEGSKGYFLSNFDQPSQDRMALYEYDFATDKVTLLHKEPDVDLRAPLLGYRGDVVGVLHLGGRTEKLLLDDQNKEAQFFKTLVGAFKGQTFGITSYSRDGKQAIVQVRSDRNPGEFYLFEVDKLQAKFLVASLPDLKPEQMVQVEPVVIKARDGLTLHALLTKPKNAKGPVPLLVNVHGGPFGITDFWGFDPEGQFFASRGWAVLQVNYRGSGNRGTDFQEAGYRQWGLKMQEDLVDATQWAVSQGVADPKRMCIYGGSYGGYAALAGIIKDPDLYRCAVGIVGVYDLVQFRKGDGSDFSRLGGDYFEKFMARRLAEKAEDLVATSPVHNVTKIKVPVFIIHGSNDVRVPIEHANRLREAMDKAGKPYEWMVKPEGHGFYNVDNRVEMYTKVLEFLTKHTQ